MEGLHRKPEIASNRTGRFWPQAAAHLVATEWPLWGKAAAQRIRKGHVSAETFSVELLKQMTYREIPIHSLAGVPLRPTGVGINSFVEELSVQPVLNILIFDSRLRCPGR